MSTLPPAVHRAIICVDVEGFGDRRRTNPHQLAVRNGLYWALRAAFATSGVPWEECHHEDRGDGALILVPPEVPKNLLVASVPNKLAAALGEHNQAHDRPARIRLRMAVHAGEIHHDEHGVAGTAINLAFRLLEADALKRALASSSGVLAVIASQWFYEEVIRHDPASVPSSYRRVHISVKETQTTAWISLPDDPYPPQEDAGLPPAPMVAVPRQLPAPIAGFAGREAELKALTRLLEQAAAGGTVVISAIGGTAGIGKTALAVHWAHQVAGHFPDGQLYVNLRGFDPAGSPMTPAEAVRGFLDAFQVPPERIPAGLQAQVALFRTLLAGRHMLVILDNARDADQVRPLLPGSPGCVVVVTSRNQLTSLITTEGARPLTLGLLTVADARQLLARRIGTDRVAAEPQPVAEITTRCARLPLALAIVAARAAIHPGFQLATLATELRSAQGGLKAFDAGDQTTDARAVFSWSYQQLNAPVAQLFRLLGLHPGPDITAPAAASLAGIPVRKVGPMLAELARSHLIEEHLPGRFAFHDLLRAYAAEQAMTLDTEVERHAALQRVLDHYLHTAHTAALFMYPTREPIPLAAPHSGVTPEDLADYAAAWTWFTAEHPVLLAAVQLAVATGRDTHAWQLPWTLVDFFRRRGYWHDCVATHHTALTAARRQADRQGLAHTCRALARACRWLGHYDEAHRYFQQALHLFEELGDQTGQAETHIDIGRLFNCQARPGDALTHHQQALALLDADSCHRVQAGALNNIGWCHTLLGHHHQAITYCQQSLTLRRKVGDRRGEASTLDSLGYAYHHLGHYQQSVTYYQQSLALKRELGDRWSQATTLTHLGDTHHATGDLDAARTAWQEALDILDHLGVVGSGPGYPEADQVRVKLQQLDIPAPDPQLSMRPTT